MSGLRQLAASVVCFLELLTGVFELLLCSAQLLLVLAHLLLLRGQTEGASFGHGLRVLQGVFESEDLFLKLVHVFYDLFVLLAALLEGDDGGVPDGRFESEFLGEIFGVESSKVEASNI